MSRKRRNWGYELWERGREFVRADDGLPVYDCGAWTIDKLYFLSNYIAQMTQAMAGNPNYTAINYIDLFASSGVCRIRDEHTRRYAGSALLSCLTEKPFDSIYLIEQDTLRLDALRERVARTSTRSKTVLISGNCNEVVSQLSDQIPPRSLSLAFVDPFSLDIDFETIRQLTQSRKVDLLILFADDMDLVRNVERYYYPNDASKLDRFLGTSEWRSEWDRLPIRDAAHVRQMFASIYLNRLRKIGYTHSATRPIDKDGRPLYRLVFASAHPLGLKFWRIAESEDWRGNRGLFRTD